MELSQAYMEQYKKRQVIKKPNENPPEKEDERPEVDLGDLIERLKIQIDYDLKS